ncbi:hypothetical protein SAMN05892883_2061 [Jatrophihabitans sp. GAS493]|uniref:glycoside hydrolase domain-containing protein n=1 Tax=Jatrophihabitans sp. GAS493 TaxID=1907575 RepID=UPI000BB75239|nr:glycoside hydrolase domain-containing protein [Jatrophihabitans sp. GAS493]SOD72710.1 hypothetical protein SAMN05892883_2061 [Jatrophihabitans sp. GAS493]
MTTGTAYDAAYPPLDAELASDALFVCAYLDGPHAYTKAKVAKIHAEGKGVLLNHERLPGQLLGGAAAGVQAAKDGMAAAVALGAPTDGTVAIHNSVDVSVPAAQGVTPQFKSVGSAFDSIKSIYAGKFLAGAYGEGALIDYLAATKRIQVKGWLSGSKSFPGYNRASPNVGMYQLVGTDIPGTDKNIVTDAESLGVWWPDGHPLKPNTTGGFLMALSDAQQQQVLAAATGRQCILAVQCLDGDNKSAVATRGALGWSRITPTTHAVYVTYQMYCGGGPLGVNAAQYAALLRDEGDATETMRLLAEVDQVGAALKTISGQIAAITTSGGSVDTAPIVAELANATAALNALTSKSYKAEVTIS